MRCAIVWPLCAIGGFAFFGLLVLTASYFDFWQLALLYIAACGIAGLIVDHRTQCPEDKPHD